MGHETYAAKRGPDFEAVIQLIPAEQGGLEGEIRWDYHSLCLIRFLDGVPVLARLIFGECDLTPGETINCWVVVPSWGDDDRRNLDAGMQFAVLLPPTKDASGPPQSIGLGCVVKLRDPKGRRFFADAEASIVLLEAGAMLSTLDGRPLEWRFARHGKSWHGHIDTSPVPAWSTMQRTEGGVWLCFYDLRRDMRTFPETGLALLEGDVFEIIDDERHIGQGIIKAWTPRGSKWGVCYPLGWKIGAGVTWRRHFSS